MLLHNQTKQRLRWDGSGRVFEFEPYGSCEVPDEFAAHMRTQKVPVGEIPVTPERKAHAAAEDGAAAARNDELLKLRERCELAEADAKTARAAVVAAEERRDKAESEVGGLKAKVASLTSELAAAKADAAAAMELTTEQGKRLEQAERAAAKNPKKGDATKSAPG